MRVARHRLRHELDPAAGRRRRRRYRTAPRSLVDVHREMRVVRLGEGVDATGRLSTHALDRTWRALADYAAVIRASGRGAGPDGGHLGDPGRGEPRRFRRDGDLDAGQRPEVITGDEEAELSFAGAVGELDPATGPFLVVDIGGGSTELVIGTRHRGQNRISGSVSLDIGCVRITERILRSDPPTAAERDEATRWVRSMLHRRARSAADATVRRLVPVSGTATTVAAAALKLPTYDPARIHLSRIPADQVHKVAGFPDAGQPVPPGGARLHASRPGGRHRRRCADPVHHGRAWSPSGRRSATSPSPNTTSSTGSRCPSRRPADATSLRPTAVADGATGTA